MFNLIVFKKTFLRLVEFLCGIYYNEKEKYAVYQLSNERKKA